jgi:ABC-type sugar transport system substrate-binding protein
MKKSTEQPLTKLADGAFEQAAKKVIERAKESGTPVIVWEDESVKEVEPRKVPKIRKTKKGA